MRPPGAAGAGTPSSRTRDEVRVGVPEATGSLCEVLAGTSCPRCACACGGDTPVGACAELAMGWPWGAGTAGPTVCARWGRPSEGTAEL